jgi:hypothetical protein
VTDATIEFVAESGNSTALIGFHRAVSSWLNNQSYFKLPQ